MRTDGVDRILKSLTYCWRNNDERRSPVVLSVVMPVFNVENYIEETIGTLKGQTFSDFEVILVDDGSTDSTLTRVAHAIEGDVRFGLYSQENSGAAQARNNAMRLARGNYIIFLDADDLFEPTMFEKMIASLDETGAEVCVCNSVGFDSATGEAIDSFHSLGDVEEGLHKTEDLYPRIFQIFEGTPWDKMYRLDFIRANGYEYQDLKKSNDNFFTFANLLKSDKIVVLKDRFVRYRCSAGGSIQDKVSKNNECIIAAVNKINKLPVPLAAKDSLMTWSLAGYLRAFELTSMGSKEAARDLYDGYWSDYRCSWDLDKSSPAHMMTRVMKYRFWCVERLSFEGLYKVYSRYAEKRYKSKLGKIIDLLYMLALAILKS